MLGKKGLSGWNTENRIVFIKNRGFGRQTTVKLSNLMHTKSKSNRIETNRIESKTKKNFLILKVLELREIFERNRNESNSEYKLNSELNSRVSL